MKIIKRGKFIGSELILALLLTTNLFKAKLNSLGIPDITVVLILLSVIILVTKTFTKTIIFEKKTIFMMVLWAILVVIYMFSFFYTPSISYAEYKLFEIVIIIPFIIILTVVLVENEKKMNNILLYLVALGILFAFGSLKDFFLNKGIVKSLSSFDVNYLAYSRQTFIAFVLLLFYFDKKEGISKKVSFIIRLLAFLCAISTFFSGARSTTVLVFVICFYWIFNLSKNNIMKTIFLTVFFLGLIFFFYRSGDFDYFIYKMDLSLLTNDEVGRFYYLKVGVELFSKKMLLGNGVGSFPIMYSGKDVIDYPHNIIIEILDEVGIVGMIIFLIFCTYSIFFWKKRIYCGHIKMKNIFFPFLLYIIMMIAVSSVGSARLIYFIFAMPFSRVFNTKR